MRCSRSIVLGIAPLAAVAALCWPAPASAQDPAVVQKVTDLNRKAVDAYENLEMEEARKFLRQALEICAAEGMNNHKAKARTHIHLGIVMIAGLKQREQGIQQFRRALEIDPGMPLTKSLVNPEIQAAFDEAHKDSAGTPTPKAEPPKAEPREEPKAEPPPSEGRPPKKFKGVFHEPVTEGRPASTITIKAAVEPALSPDKVVLAYRPEGATDFLARDMEKESDGWWVARIPEPATKGTVVAYYVEARSKTGTPLAGNGSAGEPHVISLSAAPEQAAGGDAPSVASGGDDEPGDSPGEARDAGSRKFWLSLGLGAGFGWANGTPEVNQTDKAGKALKFSGPAPANLMHVVPEIGIFYSANLILSLQGRIQFITGATEAVALECPDDKDDEGRGICYPAKYAPAILAKATWLLGQPAPFRPFVSAMAGAGEIRHLVTVAKLEDCGPSPHKEACRDTILGGRFLLGPGAGFTYDVGGGLALVGTVQALAGLPNTTLNFDLNVGIGYGL